MGAGSTVLQPQIENCKSHADICSLKSNGELRPRAKNANFGDVLPVELRANQPPQNVVGSFSCAPYTPMTRMPCEYHTNTAINYFHLHPKDDTLKQRHTESSPRATSPDNICNRERSRRITAVSLGCIRLLIVVHQWSQKYCAKATISQRNESLALR